MTFTFRPAVREAVGLILGLAGASGSGKTFTAMRLASGIMEALKPGTPFAVIDTEAGRAKHYADMFRFDHGDLRPPFTPAAYADAIAAADAAHYPVIVVDSFSHEHAGEGGILDMQEAEYQRLGATDKVKMLSWVKPKVEHRRMVSRLLQVRAHLIVCLRAEEKIEMVRDASGKMEVRKKQTTTGLDGWVPICEKTLPYELTASCLLLPSNPGVPLPIKLQAQHRPLFPLTEPITEESGRRLAQWAAGREPAPADRRGECLTAILRHLDALPTQADKVAVCDRVLGVKTWAEVKALPLPALEAALVAESEGGITRIEAEVIRRKEAKSA